MSDSVRVGVVGGGIRGNVFAQVVDEHPKGELVGFVEPNPQVAKQLREQFGTEIHGSTQELIDAGAEAIVIATPDFAHLEPGLTALRANKHVLFEKPLATEAQEAVALRDAARTSTGHVVVGFENRWNPKFRAVHEILQREGAPLIAQRALLQDTEFVPRRMLSWAAASTPGWFLFPHSLDMAMWLSGARPVEVYARGVKKVLAPDGIDTFDRISASFLMSDDSILDLDSGWVLPESRPAVFEFRYDVESRGSHFEIEVDNGGVSHFGQDKASYVGAPGTDSRGRLTGANVEMMRDFIDLCAGDDVELPGIDAGYEVTIAIAALHESLNSNQNIAINY